QPAKGVEGGQGLDGFGAGEDLKEGHRGYRSTRNRVTISSFNSMPNPGVLGSCAAPLLTSNCIRTSSRRNVDRFTIFSMNGIVGNAAAKWTLAATRMPDFQACGTNSAWLFAARSARRRPCVKPPARARSG